MRNHLLKFLIASLFVAMAAGCSESNGPPMAELRERLSRIEDGRRIASAGDSRFSDSPFLILGSRLLMTDRIIGAGATREGEQGIREAPLRACERTATEGRAVAMRHGWLEATVSDFG